MDKVTKEIERFIDELIIKNDLALLDTLWTFCWCVTSTPKSGYFDGNYNKGKNVDLFFEKWFLKVCCRNLQKKFGLEEVEIERKIGELMDWLNDLPDFLSYERYYQDSYCLRKMLINKTSDLLIEHVETKIKSISNLDKKLFSFIINYIPIRIKDFVKETENRKRENPNYKIKHRYSSDFHIMVDMRTGDVVYFEIDPKRWTYIFNPLFDEELKEWKFKVKEYRKGRGQIPNRHETFSFWQFGDELVKVGIGYWAFKMSSGGRVTIKFIIPNFIYEAIKDYRDKFSLIENFEEKINEIKKQKESEKLGIKWKFEDFEEMETVSEVLEQEIEASISSDPEIVEEGLSLVGRQYPTSVGDIDILCKDKNGNFAVIELKKDKGSYKVVGQIQKFMAWVEENLAKDEKVRGIIVVREHDQGLEYAIKGSKFPIEIKIFGKEPPTGENIRYCTKCGKANPKSAKYCMKCGQKFWM